MLDHKTNVLWAKKPRENEDGLWLPLVVHMCDAVETAKLLWHHWLPTGTKKRIALGLNLKRGHADDYDDLALPCLTFLAATHDIGKATPAFQGNLRPRGFDEQLRDQLAEANLPLANAFHFKEARHFWASQLILEKEKFSRKLAGILGGHHGQPPSYTELYNLRTAYRTELGWATGQGQWGYVQQQLLAYALDLAGVSKKEATLWQPDLAAQVLLNGLVIMVDWIVSNEGYFPHMTLSESFNLISRAGVAWEEIKLPECWNPPSAWEWDEMELFERRFAIKEPRPVQVAIKDILNEVSNPGIVILEAPMGEGKTEAALVAAELLANRTNRSGIFFALPTQASANGLFQRICNWVSRLEDGVDHAVQLVHGKADLNELYDKIKTETKKEGGYWTVGEESEGTQGDVIIVHEWFSGRKKAILSDFVIGTIDHVLMAGLKQKHVSLRHLGLSNKVVVLDECHAYDAYMSKYLYKVLNWLGAYKVPVVILSATLPGDKRKKIIDAYLNQKGGNDAEFDPIFDNEGPGLQPLPQWAKTYDYPIITLSAGDKVKQVKINGRQRTTEVTIKVLPGDEQIITILLDLLSNGGNAGIIVNTVKRAQEITKILEQFFGDEVQLLHSRFLAVDRAKKEKELFAKLGVDGDDTGQRPKRCIVVGTQIFEQSCDLDFDVLITDICPMDLLIQRIGRLHRHQRNRPPKLSKAACYITGMNDSGFDRGAELIYGKYLLMNTKALLPSHIVIPDDIPQLVQAAYQEEGVEMPLELHEEYKVAKEKQEQTAAKRIAKAEAFQIIDPCGGLGDLVGWLDTSIMDDPSGKRAEAAVRDIDNTLEVLVVQRKEGQYLTLPWLDKNGGSRIPVHMPPDNVLAKTIAECSIQLPRELCWKVDETIGVLEGIALHELREWQKSSWLKGELFLVLDERLTAELCGYHLQYDRTYGLLSKKIGEGDVDAGEKV